MTERAFLHLQIFVEYMQRNITFSKRKFQNLVLNLDLKPRYKTTLLKKNFFENVPYHMKYDNFIYLTQIYM